MPGIGFFSSDAPRVSRIVEVCDDRASTVIRSTFYVSRAYGFDDAAACDYAIRTYTGECAEAMEPMGDVTARVVRIVECAADRWVR